MELGFQGCGRTTGTPISGFFRKFWFRAFGFGVLGWCLAIWSLCLGGVVDSVGTVFWKAREKVFNRFKCMAL